MFYYTLCLNNDTDVAQYDFNAHQPIVAIVGTDVADSMPSNGGLSSHLS